MKINLTDAEKTALANYLAEKTTERIIEEFKIVNLKIEPEYKEIRFKKAFDYYNTILKETDDY